MSLPLVTIPNDILRQVSSPVEKVDEEIQKFLDVMLETMYKENGAGLAAVQVGVLKRIMVLDLGKREEKQTNDPHFFINPNIVWYSEELITYCEGCLSIPGIYPEVARPKEVIVQYLDYNGKECEMKADNWMARGVQHELDHLNGKLTVDLFTPLKKELLLKKSFKLSQRKQ